MVTANSGNYFSLPPPLPWCAASGSFTLLQVTPSSTLEVSPVNSLGPLTGFYWNCPPSSPPPSHVIQAVLELGIQRMILDSFLVFLSVTECWGEGCWQAVGTDKPIAFTCHRRWSSRPLARWVGIRHRTALQRLWFFLLSRLFCFLFFLLLLLFF